MKPTAERVRELLEYNPETGVFVWKARQDRKPWSAKNTGKVAGSKHHRGYRAIAIDRIKYLEHHLAWLYMTGEWPSSFIDHKNLDKADNRFKNLRLASFGENSANAGIRNDNTSGFRGVYFRRDRSRWTAKIWKDGKPSHIGSFKTAEEAGIAFAIKAKEVYGDFCPEYLQEMAA